MNYRSNLFAGALIVEHQYGAHKIRPSVAAVRIGAVAKSAGWDEESPAALYRRGIGGRTDRQKVSHCLLLVGRLIRRLLGGRLLLPGGAGREKTPEDQAAENGAISAGCRSMQSCSKRASLRHLRNLP
jgi:hypothetical protein